MFAFSLLLAALQIGMTNTPPSVTHYQWVAAPEATTPVAICDRQFTCHCPVGYKAAMHQAAVSNDAISVMCEATSPSGVQPRESYDSYPQLPAHENLGR